MTGEQIDQELSLGSLLDGSSWGEEGTETQGPESGGSTDLELLEYIDPYDCPSLAEADYRVCYNGMAEIYNTDNWTCSSKYESRSEELRNCENQVEANFDKDVAICTQAKADQLEQCTNP